MTAGAHRAAQIVADRYANESPRFTEAAHLLLRSPASLEALAHAVEHDLDLAEIKRIVDKLLHGDHSAMQWMKAAEKGKLCSLARVLCLGGDEETLDTGLNILRALMHAHGPRALGEKYRRIFIDTLIFRGQHSEAAEYLRDMPFKDEFQIPYLVAIANPFHNNNREAISYERWEKLLNTFISPSRELAQIRVRDDWDGVPFDRLWADTPRRIESGPLVTVVMSSFRRDEMMLRAIQSILNQTWRSLEILVIDDVSGPGYDDLYDQVAALDPRIRVVRQRVNGGTYLIRNRAISLARGEFIAFQDSDDWSHPERIERQIKPLIARRELMATQSYCIRTDERLDPISIGYAKHMRRNESSLLFRIEAVRRIGFFHYTRKGGDSEYRLRLEAAYDMATEIVGDEPLAIVRMTPGSLSRNEFKPGFRHPNRLIYQQTYALVHERSREFEDLYRGYREYRDSFVPARFQPRAENFLLDDLDVILVDDLRTYSTTYAWTCATATDMRNRGLRVGIAHIPGVHNVAGGPDRLPREVTTVFVDGVAVPVDFSDFQQTRVVIVADAALLQFVPWAAKPWRVGRVYARVLSSEPDNRNVFDRYTASRNSQEMFGGSPVWVEESHLLVPEVMGFCGDYQWPSDRLAVPTPARESWSQKGQTRQPSIQGWVQTQLRRDGQNVRGCRWSIRLAHQLPAAYADFDRDWGLILGRPVSESGPGKSLDDLVSELLSSMRDDDADFEAEFSKIAGQFVLLLGHEGRIRLRAVGLAALGSVSGNGLHLRVGAFTKDDQLSLSGLEDRELIFAGNGTLNKVQIATPTSSDEPAVDTLQGILAAEINAFRGQRPYLWIEDDFESAVTLGLLRDHVDHFQIVLSTSGSRAARFLKSRFIDFDIWSRDEALGRSQLRVRLGSFRGSDESGTTLWIGASSRARMLFEHANSKPDESEFLENLWRDLSFVPAPIRLSPPETSRSLPAKNKAKAPSGGNRPLEARGLDALPLSRKRVHRLGVTPDLSLHEKFPLDASLIRGTSSRLVVSLVRGIPPAKENQSDAINMHKLFPDQNLVLLDTSFNGHTEGQFSWFFGTPGDNLARRYAQFVVDMRRRLKCDEVVVRGHGPGAISAALISTYIGDATALITDPELVAGAIDPNSLAELARLLGEEYSPDLLLKMFPERLQMREILKGSTPATRFVVCGPKGDSSLFRDLAAMGRHINVEQCESTSTKWLKINPSRH